MADMNTVDISSKLAELAVLMACTKLDKVTAENSDEGFKELPEGYYLCEVENAEYFVSNSSGNLTVKFEFKTVENGIGTTTDARGYLQNVELEHTANRKIYKYYPMKSEANLKRFVSDMMKFCDHDDPTQPILPGEVYKQPDLLGEAIGLLVGEHIYIQNTINEKSNPDGTVTSSTWANLISWKRAEDLSLPVD